MKQIIRNTTVVSVSLDPRTVKKLDKLATSNDQNRSSLISSLINKEVLNDGWNKVRKFGQETALKMKITSEADIYRLMGDQ